MRTETCCAGAQGWAEEAGAAGSEARTVSPAEGWGAA